MNSEDQTAVNVIRCLAVDIIQKANSGHPGAPLGLAPTAHALFRHVMDYAPTAPDWPNRDRFVLSNGHGSALLYSMLHLTGYEDCTMDDLKQFRQFGSKTPGHPEAHITKGVEVTTGPLGQGVCNAIGFAIAQAHMAARFNKPSFPLFTHKTFAIVGDGCLMEGVSAEASSLAGHLGLGNLIVLYDDNSITIDGRTDLAFTEDVCARYAAYGWHTSKVANGDSDLDGLLKAIKDAEADPRPSLIAVRTTIGYGAAKQDTEKVHGSPLGDADIVNLKTKFGLDPHSKFNVPEAIYQMYAKAAQRGIDKQKEWKALFAKYVKEFPVEGSELVRRIANELPAIESLLPVYKPGDKAMATRKLSQLVLDAISPVIPELVGGSADLSHSNLVFLKGTHAFQKASPDGRYIHFGVREHGMSAICNGLAQYGCGFIPFCSTFFAFITYNLGALRLSALGGVKVIYIFTHDSLFLGEDGPTHQPIGELNVCRAVPGLVVIRPADGNETSGAYLAALKENGPTMMALTRQNVSHLEGTSAESVLKGAYILSTDDKPQLTLIATGSEVDLIVKAAQVLRKSKIATRVVSFPSWELFSRQPIEYQRSVLGANSPILAVEAAAPFGWERWSHATVCINGMYGASAPADVLAEKYGFTVGNVVEQAEKLVKFYAGKSIPDVLDRM